MTATWIKQVLEGSTQYLKFKKKKKHWRITPIRSLLKSMEEKKRKVSFCYKRVRVNIEETKIKKENAIIGNGYGLRAMNNTNLVVKLVLIPSLKLFAAIWGQTLSIAVFCNGWFSDHFHWPTHFTFNAYMVRVIIYIKKKR